MLWPEQAGHAHARLVVIGGDRHRLHEEVIFAGGQLVGGRFQRFNALRDMQDAFAAAFDHEPSERVKNDLLNLWPRLVDPLRAALETRTKDRTDSLKRLLSERAGKEAADIEAVMNELLRSIQEQLDDPTLSQEYLPGFAPAEREQFERNYDALRARVRAIPGEIEREQAAIRARFADPQPRMFPVAITFLVPQMLVGRR